MTHAWLITGPPGSGRSIAALCFAAALQCTSDGVPGCGECRACTTTMAGTHADVRRIVPEGLSIGVDEMRNIVQIASRRPGTGRWQIVRDRGRRPADRGRGECAAQGGGGAAAVDGVPAVRAVGRSRGHRDHAAFAVPACGVGDAAGRRDCAGADRDRRRCPRRTPGGRRRSAAVMSGGHGGWRPTRRRGTDGSAPLAWRATQRRRRGPTPLPRNWWRWPRPKRGR